MFNNDFCDVIKVEVQGKNFYVSTHGWYTNYGVIAYILNNGGFIMKSFTYPKLDYIISDESCDDEESIKDYLSRRRLDANPVIKLTDTEFWLGTNEFGKLDSMQRNLFSIKYLDNTFFPLDEMIPDIIKHIKRRRSSIIDLLIEDNDAEKITRIFDMLKRLSIEEVDECIEKVTAKGKTTMGAVLTDYKSKRFTPQQIEEYTQKKWDKEFGFEEPTAMDLIKVFSRSMLSNNRIAIAEINNFF